VIDFNAIAAVQRFGLSDLPRLRGGRFFADLGAFGHVGRTDLDLPWETGEPMAELSRALG
jgi:S-adenosylmethionine synthetase